MTLTPATCHAIGDAAFALVETLTDAPALEQSALRLAFAARELEARLQRREDEVPVNGYYGG